ncbi:hypothetical protein [Streptomyces flavofungini]|uniref:hypothetical protein n=1 Tax=Streptomyces flavofungini TaxID=68200 RepID=UPI0025B19CE5|nr:hypothetical protein [Streptomyces flavofungini]WJV50634.1 hypothetical protein QUY26_37130 [Streptomyces flavofungini]
MKNMKNSSPAPGRSRPHGHPGASHERSGSDCAGAVYGSLLAASVVATAGSVGDYPRLRLVLLLGVTGLVFWAAHVYAHLVGERAAGRGGGWRAVRLAAVREWPIVQAAALPAAAVGVGALLGLDERATGWAALGTAVAQQVGWATVGAARAGAARPRLAAEALVHLALGSVIVSVKVVVGH